MCPYHSENEYGPDLTSHLNSPLYFKQVEYTDKKGKKKTKREKSSAPVLYAKLISSEKSNKIVLFSPTGHKSVDPFDYLNHHCKVKMALI